MKNLTIVVPYRDESAALSRLISTLPTDIPVIVIDDRSTKPPVVPERVRVIRPAERGYFAGAVNAGLAACDTDVLVLNQDIWFERLDWLEQLDVLRCTYAMIGDGVMEHPAWPRGYVQGTFMFMRRDAITATGPLDAKRWPLWGGTCEWQTRMCRKGFRAKPIGHLDWFRHERTGNYGKSITRLLEQEPDKRKLYVRTPPLVSVVVPCHNYGRFLPDLVASLIGGKTSLGPMAGQTFGGFEVVIVDDASTDDSLAIATSLADPWKAIRVLSRKQRGGTAMAMNSGVHAARGHWIYALDSDDMLEPTALETCLDIVDADEHVVPYLDQHTFGQGKRIKRLIMRAYSFDRLLEANMVPAGIMFSKAAWREVGGYPPAFDDGRQDWAFAVALGAAGYCGQRVPQPLYLYRREGHNRTLRNMSPVDRSGFLAKMKVTFPKLYEGERPMGCCGGRRSVVQTTPAKSTNVAVAMADVGRAGMSTLEYVAKNDGRTTWYGPVTRLRYTCSPKRRVIYVDSRDVPGLLDLLYDRKPAFRRYSPPVKQDVKTEPVVEVLPIVQDAPQEQVEEIAPVAEPEEDFAPMQVTEVVAEEPAPKAKRTYTRRKPVEVAEESMDAA